MKRHQSFLELAAMAIDYPLSSSERRHLDEHLAGCQDCVRSAGALRADAVAIGSLPPVTLSDRRGDLILAAALRPAAVHRPLRLVAIAALLALLITGSIAVGALLLNRMDDDLAIVVPVPSLTPSPDPGPTATPSPSASTPIADTPSGRYVVTREDQQRLWVEVVAPDGSITRLAEGSNAAWLDADTIVYECSQPSQSVCTVDVATPGTVRIIVSDANSPAPAPDGRSIAFHRSGIDIGSTWIVDVDGSNPRELAPGWLLEWSPDGAWLAGQADSAAVEVALIRPDGTGLRSLAPGHDPAWSPSGDRLVYLYNDEQGEASLRTVDVATGEVTVPWGGSRADLSDPAWLGDRGWMFVRDGNIWRLDVGESRPVPLMSGLEIESGSLSSNPLAISPDNGWVAYTTGIDTDSRVGIVSVDGSLGTEFAEAFAMSDPRWAPEPAPDEPSPSAPAASSPDPGAGSPIGQTWTAAVIPAVPGRPWTPQAFDPEGHLRTVATIDNRLFASSPGPVTVWTSDHGSTWVPAAHDGGPATEGGGSSEWRFAATPDIAVRLAGTPTRTHRQPGSARRRRRPDRFAQPCSRCTFLGYGSSAAHAACLVCAPPAHILRPGHH